MDNKRTDLTSDENTRLSSLHGHISLLRSLRGPRGEKLSLQEAISETSRQADLYKQWVATGASLSEIELWVDDQKKSLSLKPAPEVSKVKFSVARLNGEVLRLVTPVNDSADRVTLLFVPLSDLSHEGLIHTFTLINGQRIILSVEPESGGYGIDVAISQQELSYREEAGVKGSGTPKGELTRAEEQGLFLKIIAGTTAFVALSGTVTSSYTQIAERPNIALPLSLASVATVIVIICVYILLKKEDSGKFIYLTSDAQVEHHIRVHKYGKRVRVCALISAIICLLFTVMLVFVARSYSMRNPIGVIEQKAS